MLILDGISTVENNQLFIPLYHRGHMSLKSDTTVTLALIPPRQRAGSPQLTEMIISPIDFRSWPSLWRIVATFREQPGIVNKLLRIIAAQDLNVLNEESSSVENRDLHTVELLVDTQSAGQTERDIERMRALENRILALCIEDLNFERNEPRLRVKLMKGLFNAYDKFQRARNPANKVRPLQENSVVSNRRILLPERVMDVISQHGPLRTLLVSDTKERLLRAFFLSENDGFTYVRVAHHDSPGALDAVTRELAKAFDIVNSLTRIQRQGTQNHLELLLYSSQYPSPADESIRRQIIEDLLSNHSLDFLNPQFSYPNSVAAAAPPGRRPQPQMAGKRFSEQKQIARINERFMNQSTALVLQSRVEEYEKLVEKQPSYEKRADLQQRLKKLRELLKVESEANPQPRVFVSYDFSRKDLSDIAARKLRRLKCKFVTGADPDDRFGAFRDVIITRISTCDAFLGIWTKKEDGSESPWFIWELAVAQAYKLPFRLLIQEGIDPNKYVKINPELHHRLFADTTFETESDIAIQRLVNNVVEETKKEEKLRFI